MTGDGDTAFGLDFGEASSYILLPYAMAQLELQNDNPYWRIELHGLHANPMGIDLIGDLVLGRGLGCDVDLNAASAYVEGVSRRHAMLRPHVDTLEIIDLKSTNGTFINGKALGYSGVHRLSDDTIVMLGNLTFTIRLIDHATIGDLRNKILQHAMQHRTPKKADNRVTKPIPAITEEDLATGRSPEAISRWMNANRDRLDKSEDDS